MNAKCTCCGTSLRSGAKYCEECGVAIDEMNDFDIVDKCLRRYKGLKTRVKIPSCVTKIGDAFHSDYDLEEVIIPDGVKEILGFSFYRCKKLSNVIIPDSVEYIGQYAFYGCENITRITLKNVKKIQEFAFQSCYRLREVELSQQLIYMGAGAFFECQSLGRVEIPDGIESVYAGVFTACSNAEVVYKGKVYKGRQLRKLCEGAWEI